MFHTVSLAVLLVIPWRAASQGAGPAMPLDPARIEAMLRAADGELLKAISFTARGSNDVDPRRGKRSLRVSHRARFTSDGSSFAIEREDPEYGPLDGIDFPLAPGGFAISIYSPVRAATILPDGTIEVRGFAREPLLYRAEVYRRQVFYSRHVFSRGGDLLEAEHDETPGFASDEACLPMGEALTGHPGRPYLLGTGRFLSLLVEEVKSVVPRGDLLFVVASTRHGRLEMLLDPASGLLAREWQDNGGQYVMSGTLGEGALPIARSARWRRSGFDTSKEIEYLHFARSVDAPLLERLEGKLLAADFTAQECYADLRR